MAELIGQREFPADDRVLTDVLEYITGSFEEAGCPPRALMQLEVSAEEIFVNIAHYGYPEGTGGKAKITLSLAEGPAAVVEFADHGVAFDPLAKPDADITLSAEERRIGGLGILMVKKAMDNVSYRREDGMNILTLEKRFA